MKKELEDIYSELQEYYQNLKGEVFVTEILNNSELSADDINIHNTSSFSRPFRRDLVKTSIDRIDENNPKLKLIFSRNGLYDFLPQGLFHSKQNTQADSFKDIRQKNKNEERDTRAFFSPLENEFFFQKVAIEQNERALIEKFEGIENDFLIDLWGLDRTIPLEYNLKLLKILPFAYQISGNIQSMETCLSHILNVKTKIKQGFKVIKNNEAKTADLRLDVDFTLNTEESKIYYPFYTLEIGPLSTEEANTYGIGSDKMKFISNFSDYFIPIDIDLNINIIQDKTNQKLELSENNTLRLGLTTIL